MQSHRPLVPHLLPAVQGTVLRFVNRSEVPAGLLLVPPPWDDAAPWYDYAHPGKQCPTRVRP
jgi:hypothetical protein